MRRLRAEKRNREKFMVDGNNTQALADVFRASLPDLHETVDRFGTKPEVFFFEAAVKRTITPIKVKD